MFNNYNDIKMEYERIRQQNVMKSIARKRMLYERHPDLKMMDDKLLSLWVEIVKKGQNGEDTGNVEKELSELRQSRIEYLKKNNIKDDYRDVHYECNKCKDTGFVNGKKCSCYIDKEIQLYDTISNFRKYIETDNFDNLKLSYYKQGDEKFSDTYYQYMEEKIKEIKSLVSNMETEPFNIMLRGIPGTGKTFLARCIGDMALKLKKTVLYLNAVEYIDSLIQDYDGISLKQFATKADLLILDDLGVEYSSDFSKTAMNYVIDKRLNNNLSTVITTNLIMEEDLTDRYLSPMCSRLLNMYKSIFLSGMDLRRLKNVK